MLFTYKQKECVRVCGTNTGKDSRDGQKVAKGFRNIFFLLKSIADTLKDLGNFINLGQGKIRECIKCAITVVLGGRKG